MINNIRSRLLMPHEVIINALKIYWKNIKYILPVGLFVYIPINIIISFFPVDLLERFANVDLLTLNENADYYLRYSFILIAVMVIFTPLLAGAISYITVQAIEDKPIKITGIMDSSLMRWGKLVYTTALYYSVMFVSLFFVFPAIYFGIAFMLFQCIAAVSNKYGFSSLLISRVLMKGKWLRGLVMFMYISLAKIGIQYIFGTIIDILNIPSYLVVNILVVSLGNALSAISYVAICLFYINIHYNYNKDNKEQLI